MKRGLVSSECSVRSRGEVMSFEPSGRWWGMERPGMLQSMDSQRVGHDLVTEQQQQWVLKLEVSCGSIAKSCLTLYDPWTTAHRASLSLTISWSLSKFMSIELVMPSNHLILCHPFFLLPSVFPTIRISSSELALHTRWPKYWSFSFRISPFNEYSALISFRADWFDLHAVQGTHKSLLQHNSKASVLQCSAFFMVQLSHPYITLGKTIALTIQTFVGKVMSLLEYAV